MLSEILIALALALLVVGIYSAIRGYPPGVSTYQMPPLTPNGMDPGQAKFMFFYTPWCPHCKTAQPVWASLKETLKNTPSTFGGHTVLFEEINCDSDKGKSALYKIEGYPTFKLETDSKLYDFKGRPSVAGLEAFLTQVLGQKKAT
jgi:thiol-disulfide isomerase/thioredoxin